MGDWASSEILDTLFIERLQSGDEAAFEQLIRRYGGQLLRVARRFLRNEDDARDALQDAFLSIFKSIGRFESKSTLSTWLHRIVVNASLMKLRRQRALQEEDIEPLLPRFLEDGHQVRPSVVWYSEAEALSRQAEVCQAVRQAIDRLPDSFRTVLLLRDIEELSTDETAEVLGLTPNAVKIRLHRARQALRELLDPQLRKP
jgi:RNA polymerase sigma-70 factor, ECF subfamily